MIAESIAHYRILKKLGAGGMGDVYLALDTKLDRKVAIKVLQQDSVAEENLKRRLIREAQAAARLDHPNICAVYDVNEIDSITFIVMQYIEGETLAQKMERQPLSLGTSMIIAKQATEGLAEAHAHGVIHRDLKPQNMLITPRGQLKILDFGLAKQLHSSDSVDVEASTATLLSTPGHVIGTVPYMSPEQLRGEPLDASSDIFSLGVTFYEMLAGKHPFQDKSAAVTMSRIMLSDPVPTEQFLAHTSPQLQAVVSKMLSKDKANRYQTAEDLLADLRQLDARGSTNSLQTNFTPTKQLSAIKTDENRGPTTLTIARSFKWPAIIVSVLALFLIAAAVYRLRSTARIDSLAVLPFTYFSNDPKLMSNPDREYLSDGLTEGIINNLSQLANLKVIARSSVFRYKGRELDVQTIGRELNVRAALVGHIRQEGDQSTIDVELMDVQENRSIWGDTYRQKTTDIQTVQKEIASKVSEKLGLQLTGADQSTLSKTDTQSGAAYEAYLKGRYHWNKRTEEGFKQATIFFQDAIDKDPNYALAYTGLADCYTLRSDYGFLAPKEGYALAKGAVNLALKYDASLAEAHTSLASIKAVTDWDWQGAEDEYRKALELNPKYPTAHHWYAAQLLLQGRLDEALKEIKLAQQLDPLSLGINKDFAVILLYARNYDRALEQCRKTLEIEPQFGAMFTYIAQIYELQQKYPEARAELEKAHASAPDDVEITNALGQAYALAGQKDEALRISRELDQAGKNSLLKEAAYLHWLLDDKEKAIAILQKAADDHYIPVAELKMDPRLDELRKDPRVIEILKKIGLSP